MKKHLTLFIFIFIATNAFARDKNNANTNSLLTLSNNNAPLSFVENVGQVTDQNHRLRTDIQFSLRAANGLNIFIGNGAIHYQFSKCDNPQIETQDITSGQQPNPKTPIQNTQQYTMYRMDVELAGVDKHAKIITEQKQDYYENYFTDWSGEKGATAHTYQRITYKDIYPNIDWVLYVNNGQLKHEFVVRQGGKTSDIKLKYGGATDLKINAAGDLVATTPQGTITEEAPNTFQKDGKKINSHFLLNTSRSGADNAEVSYVTDTYIGELIVDPTLTWATYYGSGITYGRSIATDGSGNVYFTGQTTGISDIATSGAYQTTHAGGNDVFLAKFNSSGAIQWATYYGGSGDDVGYGVTTDGSGNVYITGYTSSTSGIATPGAYQTTDAGGNDAFLAKFNSSGAIQWATYYGGSGTDIGYGVATDGSGNVYITGYTTSTSGIATASAYQTTNGGGTSDVFLAEFNSTGAIQQATYYGGNGADGAYGVATDGSGNVYIFGQTSSTSVIATSGAYQTTYAGGDDAFLAKFNSSGAIQWATYYGGSGTELGSGVATDGSGNVYITGYTTSTAGIATSGAYQTTNAGGNDVFLTKFNSSGAIQWATYYGGSSNDDGAAVAIDGIGNVYIAGYTSSISGIAISGAYQTTNAGSQDAFFAEFNNAGTIQWATYYGGSGIEYGYGVAVDGSGNAYIMGYTASTLGIATAGAYQTTFIGGDDAFLAKFNICPLPTTGTITGTTTVCETTTTQLSDNSGGGVWSSISAGVATISATGLVTGVTVGTSTISYTVTNSCGIVVAATTLVTVNPALVAGSVTGTTTLCAGTTTALTDATGTSGGVWSSSNTGMATVSSTGVVYGIGPGTPNISYTVTNSCGSVMAFATITVNPLPSAGTISGLTLVCLGSTTTLSDGAGSGTWSSSNAGIATVDASGVVYGVTTGVADITYSVTNGCGTTTTYSGITVSTVATAGTISGAATVCVGASTLLSDGVGGGVWISSNISSATVDASGRVYGVATGTTNITYTVTSSCGTATATTTISVNPLPVAGSVSGLSSVCMGASISLTDGTAGGNWSSDNIAIATVSSTGTVDGVSAGSATISYSVTNSCGVTAATQIITVNSCTTGIQSISVQTATITIFPNPATNELNITSTANITAISINNLIGQTLYAHKYNSSQVQVDVSVLPAGIYVVRINGTEVRKFIKQ